MESVIRFRPGVQAQRLSLGLVVTILSTAACTPAPDRALHSVEDYLTDPTLRHAEFLHCSSDPGTFGKTPDCINVAEAERRAGIGTFRELAPLKTPEENK